MEAPEGMSADGHDEMQEGVSLVDQLVTSLPSFSETEIFPLVTENVRLDLTGDLTGVIDWELLRGAEAVASTMDAPYVYYTPNVHVRPLHEGPSQSVVEVSPLDTFESVNSEHEFFLSRGSPDEATLTVQPTTPTTTPATTTTAPAVTTTVMFASTTIAPETSTSDSSPSSFIEWLRWLDWGWHHWHHEEEGMGEYLHNTP